MEFNIKAHIPILNLPVVIYNKLPDEANNLLITHQIIPNFV